MGGWLLCVCLAFVSQSLATAQEDLTKNTVYQLVWSPDGDRIASADYSNTITISDGKTQKSLLKITGLSHNLSALRWSPDGAYLAGNSYDAKMTFIWDATTGKLLQSIQEDT